MAIETPARRGQAELVARGQHVTVIDKHGDEMADPRAFNAADLSEFTSMERTRGYGDLRAADIHVLRVLSNCPQIDSPCNDSDPTPARLGRAGRKRCA
jgi:uncharacterized protein YcgI (DUF1989 family)